MTTNQYEFQQNPLDLTTFDTRKRWQLRPPPQFPAPWAEEWGADEYGLWQTFSVKGIPLTMRYIPPGQFLMGSPEDEQERGRDETQHLVAITEGFWLAETTVTQAFWRAVMGENPSHFNPETNKKVNRNTEQELPVEQVSWDNCQQFFKQINQLLPELHLTFPTEAQWEYACRAGSQSRFHTGKELITEHENHRHNYIHGEFLKEEYLYRTAPVKSFKRNAEGLYQMHGNIREWCLDGSRKYSDNFSQAINDPLGPIWGGSAVCRGGDWSSSEDNFRSAYRDTRARFICSRYIGVRPCISPWATGVIRNSSL